MSMEKDIDRIPKNPDTDIVIRVDDFGGKRGVTIREFVRGERYTGFTKSGTRISAEHFKAFKHAINSIDEKELMEAAIEGGAQSGMQKNLDSVKKEDKLSKEKSKGKEKPEVEDVGEEEF